MEGSQQYTSMIIETCIVLILPLIIGVSSLFGLASTVLRELNKRDKVRGKDIPQYKWSGPRDDSDWTLGYNETSK